MNTPTSSGLSGGLCTASRRPRALLVAAIVLALLSTWHPSGLAAAPASKEAIRSYLEGLAAGGPPDLAGYQLHSPRELAALYTTRSHLPLWTAGGPLTDALPALLQTIEASVDHGFNRETYHRQTLLGLSASPSDRNSLLVELLATDALLTQARHRAAGVVQPDDLDPEWRLAKPAADPVGVVSRLIERGEDVRPALESLWPVHREYALLLAERRRIARLPDTNSIAVPQGPLLKPGQSSDRVVSLKRRLLGPGDYSIDYDTRLAVAVKAFQAAAGLEDDGFVGPATLEVLNATRFSWLDRLDANLERWRWLPDSMPADLLQVNIAAFQLRVIQNGTDAMAMRVIVGSPYRRTPVFVEQLRYMVLNPFWNVPFSIATKDKLPLLKSAPQRLDAQGYEVRPARAESFVPVSAVNWQPVTASNWNMLLRQRPGPDNALGHIKFMLPNDYAIYLHGTPDQQLFDRRERGFSSGCIRVEFPLALAQWLLQREARSELAASIPERIASAATESIHLTNPLPVYIVYFTAFVSDSGEVVFRRDLYQRDAPIVAALRKG